MVSIKLSVKYEEYQECSTIECEEISDIFQEKAKNSNEWGEEMRKMLVTFYTLKANELWAHMGV